MKVSDVIAEFLAERGVKHAFGIIGSGNAHIFDSISRRGYTEIVCVHHEQAAVMAMGTYYRITGTVGAALLTTGAGSTNGVTGVVSTWMDSIPGLILSGNENSRFTQPDNPLRIWGIQGYDSAFMVSRVTKASRRLLDARAVRRDLTELYELSGSGRPGPVWLDVPMNIQAAPVDPNELLAPGSQAALAQANTSPPTTLPPRTIADPIRGAREVIELLKQARRPVLWLGHGIRLAKAAERVEGLVDQLKIPTLVSWQAIDVIDSNHPLVFGRAGIYGQRAANFVLQNCDLLLTIGTRLAVPQVGYDLSEFARAAKIAVVDIAPDELGKHGERVTLPILSDARAFMEALERELVAGGPAEGFARPDWLERCNGWRNRYPWVGPEHPDRDGFINSYPFMQRIEKFFKPDQVIVTDMGTALLSGHQALRLRKGQRLMTSTGLGEMGFGLPAAIGASFGSNRGEVLCLNCDGGMMMNLQELQTIVHHRLPIKIVVFNNDGYLMIKHTQKALFKGHYAGTDSRSGVSCPDYSRLATAFGMPSYRIRTWEDVDAEFPKLMAETGPAICEVFMHPEQFFYPKLSLAPQKDGSIVSPPLEDLYPLLPREELRENMLIGMHPKSEKL